MCRGLHQNAPMLGSLSLSFLSSYYASSVRVVYVFCVANYEEWCLYTVFDKGMEKSSRKMRLLPCLSLIRELSVCVIIPSRFLSVLPLYSRGVRISPILLKFSGWKKKVNLTHLKLEWSKSLFLKYSITRIFWTHCNDFLHALNQYISIIQN